MLKISFSGNTWVVDELHTRHGVTVPCGFETDLASVPRVFWAVYPPFGKYIEASVIHDYLYRQKFNRKEADKLFRKIMKEDGVGFLTRNLFYFAVRFFGWTQY